VRSRSTSGSGPPASAALRIECGPRYNLHVSFIPYGKREGYLLNSIPKPIRRRLSKEAEKRNTSLANVVSEVLAGRYGIEIELSSRTFGQGRESFDGGGSSLGLRLPPAVLQAVRAEADARGVAMRSVMLIALSDHFGLKAPESTKVDPARRPGRPKHGRPRGRQKGAKT